MGARFRSHCRRSAGDYADAHAQLSNAYQELRTAGLPADIELAQREAVKAVELDPGSAAAQAALGGAEAATWNWEGADRPFRRALELNPDAGRVDSGFTDLTAAFDQRAVPLQFAIVEPVYDEVGSDRRFQALVARLSFPPSVTTPKQEASPPLRRGA